MRLRESFKLATEVLKFLKFLCSKERVCLLAGHTLCPFQQLIFITQEVPNGFCYSMETFRRQNVFHQWRKFQAHLTNGTERCSDHENTLEED
jgi:hypothetical protein